MHSRPVFALALVLLLGCGDDDARTDAGRDSGPIADAGPSAQSLTLFVFEVVGTTETPLAGATVALDPAAGARVEQTTGADGKTTFEGLDLDAGVSFAVYADLDHVISSVGTLTRTDFPRLMASGLINGGGELRMGLGLVEPPERVTLSGTATNMTDTSHLLQVWALAPGATTSVMTGPAWSLKLPPTADPFRLFVYEWFQPVGTTSARGFELTTVKYVLQNQPAVSADTTVDIDLSATGETPATFSGSFAIPSGGFFDEADGNLWIRTPPEQGSAIIGHMNRIDVNTAGTAFEYEGQAVAIPGVTAFTSHFTLSDSPRFSEVVLREDLRSGSHDPGFLEPPEPTRPAFGVVQPLHDPIEWTTRDTDPRFIVFLNRGLGANARTIWSHSALPVGSTQTAFPQPPSTVDAGALFSDTVDGRVVACDWSAVERRCLRTAVARSFELAP